MKTRTIAVAAAATLALPAVAGGHAVVSAVQPQGDALTSARTSYVLRVPTERPDVGTWKVRMAVPAPVREGVSFMKVPGWRITLDRRPTGRKDEEGNAIMATRSVTWTARSRDAEADPGFYGEFPFRFQNPSSPTKLCFPTNQWYRKNARTRSGGERVNWTGAASSDTPASCVDIKAAPAG